MAQVSKSYTLVAVKGEDENITVENLTRSEAINTAKTLKKGGYIVEVSVLTIREVEIK